MGRGWDGRTDPAPDHTKPPPARLSSCGTTGGTGSATGCQRAWSAAPEHSITLCTTQASPYSKGRTDMGLIAKTSITRRLYIAAFILVAALGAAAWYTSIALSTVSELADRTERLSVPQLQRMAALELNITRVSLQLRHAMLSRTPEEMTAAIADIGEKRK